MSETKILKHLAVMTELREQGVQAEATPVTRWELAEQYGVRIPNNQIPLRERESWTLPQAAKLFSCNIDALRVDANLGILPTYRPRSRRGTRSWRRVTRKAMEEYIARFAE